ncbi:MAG: M3 family metallopeptidase [Acidimicrobiia bacterium]
MEYDLSTATAESVEVKTNAAIEEADKLVAQATTSDSTSFSERIAPLDAALSIVADAQGYGPLLSNFHPDKIVRDAGNDAEQLLTTWASDLIARRDVYASVNAVPTESLEGLERRSSEHWKRDLRLAGHELTEEQRETVKALRQRLIELQVVYAKNLAEYKDHLDVNAADIATLPKAYRDSLGAGDAEGSVRITLDYPAYVPFMEQAPNRDQRRILQNKYLNRAVGQNRVLLEEAITIRAQIAAMLGFGDWAEYATEIKMATPQAIEDLYSSVIPGLTRLGMLERDALELLLRTDVPGGSLEPWDRSYYHNLQQRIDFGVDQNEVAEYFPLDSVIDGMLDVTGDVFGLAYTELDDYPTWHDDVRTFRIDDTSTGEAVALFYLDLHPRDGKYTHAACWSVTNRRLDPDGSVRIPVSAVAANFTKPTHDTPSLLKHDEAVTLWHEFGHVLHACLTEVDEQRFAGFDTEWDFVEAPSQIMENWMWQREVLRRFARHHRTGDPIPDDLVAGLIATRNHNIGLLTLRQVFLGKYDLLMHTSGETPDLEALEREANAFTLLPSHEDTFMASSFGHLMGGYDAGYYGYLWSAVYGDDMFSVFEEEGILSPDVGRRYRKEVLAAGHSRDAWEHLRAFLGREPNSEAFLANLGISSN